MKRVTKNNLIKLIELKKEFEGLKSKTSNKAIELLNVINNYINVINKDKRYYKKLYSYNFSNEDLKYLL